MVARTIPLAPFLSGRGKIIWLSGGHPQTPGSGAAPLCTPRMHALGDSRVPSWDTLPGRYCEKWSDKAIWRVGGALRDSYDSGLRLNRGAHHPPSPLPLRKGADIKALWGTPPAPRQRGCAPLHSPLQRSVIARSGATKQSGEWEVRCGTLTIRGYVSIGARTIPLAPFLRGKGKKE